MVIACWISDGDNSSTNISVLCLKWLMTICVVSSFMGLISPSPDYMDVIILLRKVPKGAMIQATENGLVWYL